MQYSDTFRRVETHRLVGHQFYAQVHATHEMLDALKYNCKTSVIPSHISDELNFRMCVHVYGTSPEEHVVEYPETWLDAFKERWFPRIMLKRFPVSYKRTVIRKFAIYPMIPRINERSSVELCIPVLQADTHTFRKGDE